ncbi:transglycosylase domain-containing protein [Microbacterium sp. CJ88]|uniref:transglycosylase domain-containing protein n=1 Tax=Microbacterium sp. CJ88 TaxID=3445672 RepID=UPI003F654E14
MPDTKRTTTGVLGGIAGLVGLSAVAGVLITATVTPAIAVSGAAASSAITMFDNLPSVLDIEKLMLPTTLYYTNPADGTSTELAQFYDQNRSPVTFDQITPIMYDAMLSSEDPRFYQHGGIDLIGTTRALLSNAGGGQTQGGSSISQQYVKNILIQRCEANAPDAATLAQCFTDATQSSGPSGIQRKLQEMRYSIALEQKYSKNEILLGYLNIANFGGITYGIDAAAKYYFNTPASGLNVGQAATLAGILQNPNTYRLDDPTNPSNGAADGAITADPGQLAVLDALLTAGTITQEQYTAAADPYTATKVRQLYVLSRMFADGKITKAQYDEAAITPITPTITPATTGCAVALGSAYFCQYVKNVIKEDPAFGATLDDRIKALQRGGLSIYTTMDPRVQYQANKTMSELTPTSVDGMVDGSTGMFGSTSVSIEASTGRILAIAQNTKFNESVTGDPNYSSLVYAGNSTYGQSTGFEAGSTFKLFTLVDWLEKGHSVNETVNGVNRAFKKFTTCDGTWTNGANTVVKNFSGNGYVGTPMSFTRDSLNSGFFAMAEQLDLCDIQKVATKMGVTRGDGSPIQMNDQFSIIGSNNVTPIAMAGAYATIANNGIYCQPKIIDRVVTSDGVEMTPPATSCSQVVDPKVAATTAYALQGVMNRGGTGATANPGDGTALIGKTGTHEDTQTWMIESSSKVATAAWVGNSNGKGNIFTRYINGQQGQYIRYGIARQIQGVADSLYGGTPFPQPDTSLTKPTLKDLPNVVGQPLDQAIQTLKDAGFDATAGPVVDSDVAAGLVAAQTPPAGRIAAGTQITLSPSNGQGAAIPPVSGDVAAAVATVRGAGFGNVQPGTCTVDPNANGKPATGTNPAAGTMVNRNTAITIDYTSKTCP